MNENLFETLNKITLEEVFEAYFACRKHKRSTINALAFELDYEKNLVKLWKELNNGTYKIGRSITFVVNKPVKREIFAADFRDRVVHHLLMRRLMSIFEHEFVSEAYSCRKGKGTLYAAKDVFNKIKKISKNYTEECYILKMDIKAFFMSINKNILFTKLKKMIDKYYCYGDKNIVLDLMQKIVFHCPQNNCVRKGNIKNWDKLPKDKSLFCTGKFKGLPIGNLTSQIFANFYLSDFDKFVKSMDDNLAYGRYVDDFVIIHKNKTFLKKIRQKLKTYLYKKCKLILHPTKQYLQQYRKGVAFVGCFLLPNRTYAGKRLKNNIILKLKEVEKKGKKPTLDFIRQNIQTFNSYFGFLRHHNTFNIRKMIKNRLLKTSLRIRKSIKCVNPYVKLEARGDCKIQIKTKKGIKNFREQNRRNIIEQMIEPMFITTAM